MQLTASSADKFYICTIKNHGNTQTPSYAQYNISSLIYVSSTPKNILIASPYANKQIAHAYIKRMRNSVNGSVRRPPWSVEMLGVVTPSGAACGGRPVLIRATLVSAAAPCRPDNAGRASYERKTRMENCVYFCFVYRIFELIMLYRI